MYAARACHPCHPDRPPGDAQLAALTEQRMAELRRLHRIGLEKAERLAAVNEQLPPEMEFKAMTARNGTIAQFDRIARAVRRIVVLEFELLGLFEAPERDAPKRPRLVKEASFDERERPEVERENLNDFNDLNDLNDLREPSDYRHAPYDEVVAEIRKGLGEAAPDDDPFAPPPERRARDARETEQAGGQIPALETENMRPNPPAAIATGPAPGSSPGQAFSRGAGESLLMAPAVQAKASKARHPSAAPAWSRKQSRGVGRQDEADRGTVIGFGHAGNDMDRPPASGRRVWGDDAWSSLK